MKKKIINRNQEKRLLETLDYDFGTYGISGVLFELQNGKYEVYYSKNNGDSIIDLYYNVFDIKEDAYKQYKILNDKYKNDIM